MLTLLNTILRSSFPLFPVNHTLASAFCTIVKYLEWISSVTVSDIAQIISQMWPAMSWLASQLAGHLEEYISVTGFSLCQGKWISCWVGVYCLSWNCLTAYRCHLTYKRHACFHLGELVSYLPAPILHFYLTTTHYANPCALMQNKDEQ